MDPHVIWLVLLTVGVGYLMTAAGLSKRALEWRHRDGVCPSCSRNTRDCRCRD
jgi:hypothetical protein